MQPPLLTQTQSRRTTLASLLGAGAGLFIPAWNETIEAAETLTCVGTAPTTTEGPYWVDEKLFRSDIRTDPANGVARAGIPLALTINLQNLATSTCTPLSGAYVDIWHCDAKGIYSDEPAYNPGGGTGTVVTTGQKFLRGYQITDDNGQVKFTTIYPGWYSGRTIHIHIRVRTYSGTSVLSNFVSQIFFDEAINNLVMKESDYTRTTNRDTTNNSDMIYQVANNTRMLASTTGSIAAGYSATITLGATFRTASAAAPSIATGGVGNSVSGAPGATPGAWISIYGSGLAATTRLLESTDLINNIIPTTLGGVSVKLNSKDAFLQYISPSQINILAPADASRGTVTLTVTNAAGTSNAVSTTLLDVLPGLSVLSNYVRAVRSDGVIINGTGAIEAGYPTTAAVGPGDIISLFGTGFGKTNEAETGGAVFTGAYPTANEVRVTIGGQMAKVLFAGLVGPGLNQINVVVPATLADGDQPVLATVAGGSTQAGALLKVAASAKLTAALQSRRGPFHALSTIERMIALGGLLTPEQRLEASAPHHKPGACLVQLA
ncbi:hypothetical protein [Bryobacter aggregatus]|uniref:dioxygenase family protein n=1 Tax=Bryobacter aggregatus TaxID=360054 RepID=UPI000691C1CD|nr:hypothetical protein [Bryobacter aggregatus]